MLFTLANEIKCEMKLICVDFLIISHLEILANHLSINLAFRLILAAHICAAMQC